jgi:hypothetical protein
MARVGRVVKVERVVAKTTDATAVLVEEFLQHRFFTRTAMAVVVALVIVAMPLLRNRVVVPGRASVNA